MFAFAVFSCNRLHYLRNCIDSIAAFVAPADLEVLVVDNGSVEPGMDAYLASLPKSRAASYVKRFEGRSPHELYRAMRFAVEWARGRGHRYIHFVQDDCQFLRRDLDLLPRVRRAFDSFPGVGQLHVGLVWRSKLAKWRSMSRAKVVRCADDPWLHLADMPPCDTGFTRLSLFDQIGLWPATATLKGEGGGVLGEQWMAERCREIGVSRMHLLEPVLGMLPDAAHVRGGDRIGRYIPAPDGYYLRPIDAAGQRRIRLNAAAGAVSLCEDFQVPSGWSANAGEIRSFTGRTAVTESCFT